MERVLREMEILAPAIFDRYMRMNSGKFEELLIRFAPHVVRNTKFRKDGISPKLRLIITLRYLFSGRYRPICAILYD